MSCISDSYDIFKITNQKIISFYKANPHVNFETINLLIIDILSVHIKDDCNKSLSTNQFEISVLYHEKQKIKELESFLTNIKTTINKLIQFISNKYIIVKSEYIQEFKSIKSENNMRELSEKINKRFYENVYSLLSVVIRVRIANVSEKTKLILHQFNKILTANTEQIFPKIEKSYSKIEEYLNNFESNSAHMIQAINQILLDLLTFYDSRVKHVTESIKKLEDPTFGVYYKLIYELNDLLHQLPQQNEEFDNSKSFEQLLSQKFPTASVMREQESNQYLLIREDKPPIYIENYDVRDTNIGMSDVKQFLKRAIDSNNNSILISQYTGITSKPNYHIEIHNNIVVIYLHKLIYSSETLQIATDMIDSISSKLTECFSLSENKYSIPKDILDGINREYQQFILQKETIIAGFKEQQKYLLLKLDDIRFSTLDKYLSTRYSLCKKQGFNCELCNNFNVGTLKGLAAHKRGCARKIQKSHEISDISVCDEKSSSVNTQYGIVVDIGETKK